MSDGAKPDDIHSYAFNSRKLREEFEKLKSAKDVKQVDSILEQYELFMEHTYLVNPLSCIDII